MKQVLFVLLSKVYGFVTNIRNRLYDFHVLNSYRSKLPVVSIGNITAGGNAKTPLCIFIAGELRQRGFSPVILSRGYGGKQRGPHLVTSESSPEDVGDEPLLMFRRTSLPVVVARDRVAGARFIETSQLGNLILLDDGFQHRRLARNVDIVSVNVGSAEAIESFDQAQLLPAGLFREHRDRALRRAGMVVFASRKPRSKGEVDARLLKLVPSGVQAYRSFLEPADVVSVLQARPLPKGEIIAFCGIASPEAFFSTLRDCGYTVRATESFPDHYAFTMSDLERVQNLYPQLPMVCTEKDAVKIEQFGIDDIYMLRTNTVVSPTDAFLVQLVKRLLP